MMPFGTFYFIASGHRLSSCACLSTHSIQMSMECLYHEDCPRWPRGRDLRDLGNPTFSSTCRVGFFSSSSSSLALSCLSLGTLCVGFNNVQYLARSLHLSVSLWRAFHSCRFSLQDCYHALIPSFSPNRNVSVIIQLGSCSTQNVTRGTTRIADHGLFVSFIRISPCSHNSQQATTNFHHKVNFPTFLP